MVDGPKKRVNLLIQKDLYLELCELSEKEEYSLPGYIRHVLMEHVRALDCGEGQEIQ